MTDRAVDGLRRMRAHSRIAIAYARDHPKWREDQFAIDAIAKRVELVAEVAGYRIPRELQPQYPTIPWREITGMRNRLVHDYDRLDVDILAETVERDLPALIVLIDGIVPDQP